MIDSQAFRTAASRFPTGVTVITTTGAAGIPIGFTANSFTTVSLNPPLVLFCIERQASVIDHFESASGFVVNVLAEEQRWIADRFGAHRVDRFEGVQHSAGVKGHPVLDGALAVFECRVATVHPGGDHQIIIGEVIALRLGSDERRSLVFYRSGYTSL